VRIQYWLAVAVCGAIGAAAVVASRTGPAASARAVGRAISLVLLATAAGFLLAPVAAGTWTVRASLPLDLCDVALLVAAVSCWLPHWRLGAELTYFWGMAGTLQAVVTPDLRESFPQWQFVVFVAGHVGIVVAACHLVLGVRVTPRAGAVPRVFAITVGYTALVGVVDALSGADYMYLRHPPGTDSLLSVLGPWPWYIASAAGVAVVLFLLLDRPFRARNGSTGPRTRWSRSLGGGGSSQLMDERCAADMSATRISRRRRSASTTPRAPTASPPSPTDSAV
jgi:hypothetical integral membrane protein (TIGR02206 family)